MASFPLVHPFQVPIFAPGKEPLPPGVTEEDRAAYAQQQMYQRYMMMGMESCLVKSVMAGGAGFAMGAFFSLMSSSLAYEDPFLRQQTQAGLRTVQKAREVLKDMGRGMLSSGRGFGKIGALFAGIECCIEGYRAKNDIGNSIASGFISGGILARNSGPKAALGGGLAFAAFSAVIDLFLRRETPDED